MVTSLRRAKTAVSPRGGAQGGKTYLALRPSARQGYTRAARRSPLKTEACSRAGTTHDVKPSHNSHDQQLPRKSAHAIHPRSSSLTLTRVVASQRDITGRPRNPRAVRSGPEC